MRSGPEVLHSGQKNLDVPSLNFKKNCQKSPTSFEGISTVLGRRLCVPICIRCLQAIGFSRRWIRPGASLLRPAALPALRANRLPSAPASPPGIHPSNAPRERGTRECCPEAIRVIPASLFSSLAGRGSARRRETCGEIPGLPPGGISAGTLPCRSSRCAAAVYSENHRQLITVFSGENPLDLDPPLHRETTEQRAEI